MLEYEKNQLGVKSYFNLRDANQDLITELKKIIYSKRLIIFKNQDLSPSEFVKFGKMMGEVEEYYEDMYHHPEHKEIFVSSNMRKDGVDKGVPRTGKFWHSDYAFKSKPFAFTITYPQVVPATNRGTYFIDMAKAYEGLSDSTKSRLEKTSTEHSVRKYFKIRPKDLYQPIGSILKEIDQTTPSVFHPTIVTHPTTNEKILYASEGFAQEIYDDSSKDKRSGLLEQILIESGQMDKEFSHHNIEFLSIEKGDLLIWDNRRFIHHAKHSTIVEPSETYRLTIHDEHPFSHPMS